MAATLGVSLDNSRQRRRCSRVIGSVESRPAVEDVGGRVAGKGVVEARADDILDVRQDIALGMAAALGRQLGQVPYTAALLEP